MVGPPGTTHRARVDRAPLDQLLLVAHIATAITFIGPMTVATSLFPRAAAAGQVEVMAAYHRLSRVYGVLSLAVAAIGVALAGQTGYLSSGWVAASLALFAVAGVLLAMVVLPAQRLLMAAPRSGEVDVDHTVMQLRAASGALAVLWMGVLALMVTKPF